MRIDKYLKATKLIKRRKTSKDLASADKVLINGKPVKPSYDVKVNDLVLVKIKDSQISFKVIKNPDLVKIQQIDTTFEVISD